MQTVKVLQSLLWVHHNLLPMRGLLLRSFKLLLKSSCQSWTFPFLLLLLLPCQSLLRFPSLLFPSWSKRTLHQYVVLVLQQRRNLWFPLKMESDDAEGSGEVEESAMGRVDEETITQLWRNNQSRAAGRRVVRASNLVHPHPYAYAKGLGGVWARRGRLSRQLGACEPSGEGGGFWEDCVLPH